MIIISILIFILAIALPSLKTQLSSILLTRITTIILIFSGALAFNALYFQSIGSGIGIYSGYFQISVITQELDIFILIIGSLILIPRPGIIEYIRSTSTTVGAVGAEGAEGAKGAYNGRASQGEMAEMLINSNKGLQRQDLFRIVNNEIVSGLGDKYSLIILFSTLGSLLLLSSSDLLSMYLSIELQSFGVYILATLFRESKLATSAGLKYFLLGGFSSCLILLGSAIVYTYTGMTNLESIYSLISVSNSASVTQGLTLGIILIIIGFLFKIAAAPLHNWAPDVYDNSPTIVTIWLTIMPKIAIFIFLLDIYLGATSYQAELDLNKIVLFDPMNGDSFGYGSFGGAGGEIIKNLLLISSLLSLTIGTIVGLAQSRIKRLLAYSTISHIGFILLALAINSEKSIDSFIFYIIQYSLTNLNTFLIILALGYLINTVQHSKIKYPYGPFGVAYTAEPDMLYNIENKDIRFINELKGQFMSNPLLSLSLAICLFSMAGIPPLIGFFSKQMVLYSAIQSGYYFMSIVCIIVSVISASYYLKIVRILFSEINNSSTAPSEPRGTQPLDTVRHPQAEIELIHPYSTSIPAESNLQQPKSHSFSLVPTASYYITSLHSFLISTLTLIILLFIFKPSLLLNSTQLLSLSIFNC